MENSQTFLRNVMVILSLMMEFHMCIATIHTIFDCKKSRFGCCPDGVTDAFGWNQKGCSALLCYDKDKLCKKLKEQGDCEALDRWAEMNELCPKTCGRCWNGHKPASPTSCYKSEYGCCFDGITPAISDDKRPGVGCPYCRDLYPHACKQFGSKYYCEGKQPHTRHFLKNNCFKQCGMCTNFRDIPRPAESKDWRKMFF